MEERDEVNGLGASAQADADPRTGEANTPQGEPTETSESPKVADPDSGEDEEVAQTN